MHIYMKIKNMDLNNKNTFFVEVLGFPHLKESIRIIPAALLYERSRKPLGSKFKKQWSINKHVMSSQNLRRLKLSNSYYYHY